MTQKIYITLAGHEVLKNELHDLVTKERPEIVKTVSWAASNGDRSENADYIYGKRRLRVLDKRIQILTKRLSECEAVDHLQHKGKTVIYFGATVTILRNNETTQTITIVGQDEIDPLKYKISWTSPLARKLIGKDIGDTFTFITPHGEDEIEILNVQYV